MPKPKANQTREEFISEYMESKEAQRSFPDTKQRLAVAEHIYDSKEKAKKEMEPPAFPSGSSVYIPGLGNKD